MAKTTECEIWVLVDADGNYGVGGSEDAANQNYEDDIGTVQGNRRMVKLTLTVPLPKPMELTAAIPEEEHEAGELGVEAA